MNISAGTVKILRQRTGAGIMDCKEALKESNGDMDSAVDILRKRGIAKAEKRVGRTANQGVVLSYIHPGNRIGVLVEINCETDFVAKTEGFHRLVKDVAMQIAATNPIAIIRDEVDSTIIEREKETYLAQARLLEKPDDVVRRIVEGRLDKFFQENCLLEQPFIKDNDKTVQDILSEVITTLGENITISRFSRYEVGENSSNGEG